MAPPVVLGVKYATREPTADVLGADGEVGDVDEAVVMDRTRGSRLRTETGQPDSLPRVHELVVVNIDVTDCPRLKPLALAPTALLHVGHGVVIEPEFIDAVGFEAGPGILDCSGRAEVVVDVLPDVVMSDHETDRRRRIAAEGDRAITLVDVVMGERDGPHGRFPAAGGAIEDRPTGDVLEFAVGDRHVASRLAAGVGVIRICAALTVDEDVVHREVIIRMTGSDYRTGCAQSGDRKLLEREPIHVVAQHHAAGEEGLGHAGTNQRHRHARGYSDRAGVRPRRDDDRVAGGGRVDRVLDAAPDEWKKRGRSIHHDGLVKGVVGQHGRDIQQFGGVLDLDVVALEVVAADGDAAHRLA